MTMQELIALIDATVWPISLVTIVLVFRKYIAKSFGRLGSITASSSGLSLNFEQALEEAKDIFEEGTNLTEVSKSAVSINEKAFKPEPYEQLISIKKSIATTLSDLAIENSIPVVGKDLYGINNQLAQQKVISTANSLKISALLNAVDQAPLSIKRHQVVDLQHLYDAI